MRTNKGHCSNTRRLFRSGYKVSRKTAYFRGYCVNEIRGILIILYSLTTIGISAHSCSYNLDESQLISSSYDYISFCETFPVINASLKAGKFKHSNNWKFASLISGFLRIFHTVTNTLIRSMSMNGVHYRHIAPLHVSLARSRRNVIHLIPFSLSGCATQCRAEDNCLYSNQLEGFAPLRVPLHVPPAPFLLLRSHR